MQESKGFIGTFCLPGEAPCAILSHLINDDATVKRPQPQDEGSKAEPPADFSMIVRPNCSLSPAFRNIFSGFDCFFYFKASSLFTPGSGLVGNYAGHRPR